MAQRSRSPEPTAGGPRPRDPEGTKRKILDAGLKEFASKGFAGARVDAIARRAGVNKRMLYHYFGPKEQLYREIMRRKVMEKNGSVAAPPHDLLSILPYWYEVVLSDPDWIRLLEWEALRVGPRKVVCEDERRDGYAAVVSRLRADQAAGRLPDDLDPRYVLLATLALSIYPLAFPQMTRLVMGISAADKGFQQDWSAFLRRIGDGLRQAAPGPRGARLEPAPVPSAKHGRRREVSARRA
jgi:TetR/AcrR family transcriptional regulator